MGYCGPQGSQNGSYWLLSIWSGAGSAGYQGNVPDNPHQGERSNPSVASAIELMVSLLNILFRVREPCLFYSNRASCIRSPLFGERCSYLHLYLYSDSVDLKMAMYCPQGSGMLRQQLLMWPKYSQNIAKM